MFDLLHSGHVDVLLAAWQHAFAGRDDVQLVIKDFGTATHYRNQTAGGQIQGAQMHRPGEF